MIELTNSDIRDSCITLAKEICEPKNHKSIKIYGVKRGGIPVAYMLAGFLPVAYVVDKAIDADIIVDDIIDSGETKKRFELQYEKPFYALFDKTKEDCKYKNDFLIFPWEQSSGTPILGNILRIEQYLDSANEEESKKVFKSITNILNNYATKR